jgi:hypothetical protein
MNVLDAIGVLIVLLGVLSPIIVIGGVYYSKKRLEHEQIMAAIEKGTPLSEIIPPKPKPAGPAWIKYVCSGVALIIIGLGFTLFDPTKDFGILIFVVLCGAGAGTLIRGLLHRKYYLKNQLSAENNTSKNKK